MDKVNIKNINKIDLSHKWWFTINLSKDSFWPYDLKFWKRDCYYIDILQDRWSVLFPYKNIEFNNSEIFLETDDIIVCTWDRTNLSWDEKTFIDIINIKSEKKYRLYVEEVNLIYNSLKEIVVNAKTNWVWKTVKLEQDSLKIKEEKEEKLLAFFKIVYNENEKKWYRLKYNENYFYELILVSKKLNSPKFFARNKFLLKNIDIWKESVVNEFWLDFINNQSYILWDKEKNQVKKKYFFEYSLNLLLSYSYYFNLLFKIILLCYLLYVSKILYEIDISSISVTMMAILFLVYYIIKWIKKTKYRSINDFLFNFNQDFLTWLMYFIIYIFLFIYLCYLIFNNSLVNSLIFNKVDWIYLALLYTIIIVPVSVILIIIITKIMKTNINLFNLMILPVILLMTFINWFINCTYIYLFRTIKIYKCMIESDLLAKFYNINKDYAENDFYKIIIK